MHLRPQLSHPRRPIAAVIGLLLLFALASCSDSDPQPIPDAQVSETREDTAPLVDTPAPQDTPGERDLAPETGTPDQQTNDDAEDVTPPDASLEVVDASEPDLTGEPDVPIDPTLDSDRDGVPDVDEIEAGTDPHCPASAPAWQPAALGPHPRLFFAAEDLPALRALAEQQEGPHATLMARQRALAARPVPEHEGEVFEPYVSASAARTCQAKAFVALMDEDAALAEEAAEILAAPFPSALSLGPATKINLTEGQALIDYCTAYDLIAGSALVGDELVAAARSRLIERIDQYRELCYRNPAHVTVITLAMNNHPAKSDATLGLCAMAVNDRPTAAWDINQGLTGMVHVFAELQAAGGGFAEGWYYLVYGANNYLPFMAAYHRFARGATRPYRNIATFTRHTDPTRGQVIDVLDPVVDPRFVEVWTTALWTALPDGRLPNTDDANYGTLHGGLLAALLQDPRFLWNWEKPAVARHSASVEVATFALLDPAMAPALPTWPADGVRATAGFAVLRSDLGPDALWLLIQGEHGLVRTNGFGHEHPDEGNILLWYRGEPLLIDPGYIKWDYRHLVNRASDHNLVLINGEGSPGHESAITVDVGSDAFLSDFHELDDATTVTMRTRYREHEVLRRVVRSQGRYFIVEDRLTPAASAVQRTYTYRMNGLGGEEVPDGEFVLLATGARWSRPRAAIEAHVAPTFGAPTYRASREEHAASWGSYAHHAVLDVDTEAAGEAGFLSLLIPVATGDPTPEVEIEARDDGVVVAHLTFADSSELVVLNRARDDAGTLRAVVVTHGAAEVTVGPGLARVVYDAEGQVESARHFDDRTLIVE